MAAAAARGAHGLPSPGVAAGRRHGPRVYRGGQFPAHFIRHRREDGVHVAGRPGRSARCSAALPDPPPGSRRDLLPGFVPASRRDDPSFPLSLHIPPPRASISPRILRLARRRCTRSVLGFISSSSAASVGVRPCRSTRSKTSRCLMGSSRRSVRISRNGPLHLDVVQRIVQPGRLRAGQPLRLLGQPPVPPPAPLVIQARVAGDPVDPARDFGAAVESLDRFQHFHQHPLGDILGIVRVAGDDQGPPANERTECTRQPAERLSFSLPGPFGQFQDVLVGEHGALGSRSPRGVSRSVTPAGGEAFYRPARVSPPPAPARIRPQTAIVSPRIIAQCHPALHPDNPNVPSSPESHRAPHRVSPLPVRPAPATPPSRHRPPCGRHLRRPRLPPPHRPGRPRRPLRPRHRRALRFRTIGPTIMGGRIADLAVVESDPGHLLRRDGERRRVEDRERRDHLHPRVQGRGDGLDRGTSRWRRPTRTWCGSARASRRTGRARRGGAASTGQPTRGAPGRTWDWRTPTTSGAYRSTPRDPDVAYVAAVGHLWGPNPERGVYRTTDGGGSWERVLFVDENTGAIDLAMDPADPKTLFAAMYQRRRRAWGFNGGGPGSGIHRTTDGGDTWTELTDGLPEGDKGRIGLAIHRGDGNLVFALVEADARGSAAGLRARGRRRAEHSERRLPLHRPRRDLAAPDHHQQPAHVLQPYSGSTPNDPERIYLGGASLYRSSDGGAQLRLRRRIRRAPRPSRPLDRPPPTRTTSSWRATAASR